MKEQVASGFWIKYPENKPTRIGRYLTFNDWGFASIETWMGTRWLYSYNPDKIHITHYAGMVDPDGKEIQ